MTERKAARVSSHDSTTANLASVGIVLVVLGHSIPDAMATPGAGRLVFRAATELISLFHMPLFFFISGYLLVHTNPPGEALDYRRFVRGKVRRLLLPYWAISSAAFPVKALLKDQALRPLDFSVADYVRSLWVPWQNTIIYFWFLPTLFLLFLAAPALLRALRPRSLLVEFGVTLALVALSLSITPLFWQDPLNYRGVASHAPTFWLGMLWRARDPQLTLPASALLAGVSSLLFGGMVLTGASRDPGNSVGRLVLAWSGIAICYALVRVATLEGLRRVPVLDGRSYQIYLLSWFPQMFVKLVLFRMLGLNYWLCALLMLLGGLFVPVGVAALVARHLPRLRPIIGM